MNGVIDNTPIQKGERIMLNGELITVGDAAEILGVSTTRFRLWVDTGRIKSTKSLAGTRLVSRQQIEGIREKYESFIEEAKDDLDMMQVVDREGMCK